MIRKLIVAIAFVAVLAGVVAAILLLKPAPQQAPMATAPSAPESRFTAVAGGDFGLVAPVDGSGAPADMAPYRGKVLLVNLWATWCAPCIQELPSLGKLQAALGGDDFQVVTIAVQERDPEKIAPFLAAHEAGNLPTLVDRDNTIQKVAQITALPSSLLVGRDGQVKAILTGDARWHCGKALEAVKSFIADGTVKAFVLQPCE